MSNFTVDSLLNTPAPQQGVRTGQTQAAPRAPGAILHHLQNFVRGPTPGAHTAGGTSSGVNPGPAAPRATLFNPYLAFSSWVSQPPATIHSGGTSFVWSQAQAIAHPQTVVDPQQGQHPTPTAQNDSTPGPSRAVDFVPLEERPIL